MKKSHFVLFFGISLSIFISCETDDICLEPTTPQLIIRFYDVANPTKKKEVTNLNIWVVGKDSIIKNKKTDSIAIPLKTVADITTYKFSSSNLVDEVSFSYQRSEVFISRSCGYKFVFQNIKTSKTSSNWVKQLIIINSNIENEKNAHINILH
ncbi:MAG: DUF6452 family protein [Flavobacteriaceae bacterium]|jgi:hypothetical protein|nr:DUF6452 family protein [Flavobacteriaceae bacterium]